MPSVGVKRATRVADEIRETLMTLAIEGVLRDPNAAGVAFTGVELSDDLKSARVYVRLTGEQDPEAERKRALTQALDHASGFLRKQLADRLRLRFTPTLRFFWDESLDRAARVDSLLDEIRQQPRGHT